MIHALVILFNLGFWLKQKINKLRENENERKREERGLNKNQPFRLINSRFLLIIKC
jgi:hypothetical protein